MDVSSGMGEGGCGKVAASSPAVCAIVSAWGGDGSMNSFGVTSYKYDSRSERAKEICTVDTVLRFFHQLSTPPA